MDVLGNLKRSNQSIMITLFRKRFGASVAFTNIAVERLELLIANSSIMRRPRNSYVAK